MLKDNLSNPFIFKFVFYNYKFLTDLCMFKLPKEIMYLILKFNKKRITNILTLDEAPNAVNEIKLMSIIMLQCLFNMVESPSSACSQVISRILIF